MYVVPQEFMYNGDKGRAHLSIHSGPIYGGHSFKKFSAQVGIDLSHLENFASLMEV